MQNYAIDIKEPNAPLIGANILAKSKLDLALCIACLIGIRPIGTEIKVIGVSIEEQEWDIEQPKS